MKYKVGDKVKVKAFLSDNFTTGMARLCGRVMTVEHLYYFSENYDVPQDDADHPVGYILSYMDGQLKITYHEYVFTDAMCEDADLYSKKENDITWPGRNKVGLCLSKLPIGETFVFTNDTWTPMVKLDEKTYVSLRDWRKYTFDENYGDACKVKRIDVSIECRLKEE